MKALRILLLSAGLIVAACGPRPDKQESETPAGVGKILRSMQNTADKLVLDPLTMEHYADKFGIHTDSYGWKVLDEEKNSYYRARLMAFVDRGCITRMGVEYTLVGDLAKQNRSVIEEQFTPDIPGFTCTMDKLFLCVKPQSKIK